MDVVGVVGRIWQVFCLENWCAYYCKIYLNVLGLECVTRNKIKEWNKKGGDNQKSLF